MVVGDNYDDVVVAVVVVVVVAADTDTDTVQEQIAGNLNSGGYQDTACSASDDLSLELQHLDVEPVVL